MDDFIYYNELYDLYKQLLTEKQRTYFEEYYFNNLSLSEIKENYSISRNAISKQLISIRKKLDYFESILKLNYKNKEIEKIIELEKDEQIRNKLKDIIM